MAGDEDMPDLVPAEEDEVVKAPTNGTHGDSGANGGGVDDAADEKALVPSSAHGALNGQDPAAAGTPEEQAEAARQQFVLRSIGPPPTEEMVRQMLKQRMGGRPASEAQVQHVLKVAMKQYKALSENAPKPEVLTDPNKILLASIRVGQLNDLQRAVEVVHGDVNATSDEGHHSALHWAAWFKKPDMIKYLLEHKADVNAINDTKQTPLHWACSSGDLKCVKRLIRAGADVRARDVDGYEPAHAAAQFGHTAALDYLSMNGADLEARDDKDRTPLHWAVYKNHLILSEWLIRNKDVDIFVQDFEGRLPLHWAAAKDNLKCIETLVQAGADEQIATKDHLGKTAEMMALERTPPAMRTAKFLHDVLITKTKFFWRLFDAVTCQARRKKGMERSGLVLSTWVHVALWTSVLYEILVVAPATPEYSGWHTFFIINTVVVQVSWLCAMLMNPGYVELPVDARDSRGKGIRSSSTDDMKQSDDLNLLDANAANEEQVAIDMASSFDDDDESAPAATHVHNPLAPVSYDEALERGVADHLCVSCRLVKPLRSKHCSTCKRCVHRFDHHCPWINNCVGENNRQAFLMYVLTQFLLLLQWEVLVIIYLASLDSVGAEATVVILMVHNMILTFFTCALSLSHLRFAMYNITTNESINSYRYVHMRMPNGAIFNPFDEGCWKNCTYFWGCRDATPFQNLKMRTTPLSPAEKQQIERMGGAGGHGHSHGGGGGHGHSHGGGGGHGHGHGGGGGVLPDLMAQPAPTWAVGVPVQEHGAQDAVDSASAGAGAMDNGAGLDAGFAASGSGYAEVGGDDDIDDMPALV